MEQLPHDALIVELGKHSGQMPWLKSASECFLT